MERRRREEEEAVGGQLGEAERALLYTSDRQQNRRHLKTEERASERAPSDPLY